MKTNQAHAFWKGNLKDGNGRMQFENSDTEFPFSFKSRFEEGVGANPEMLIGSAHAGCFSMAFSNILAEEGYEPVEVATKAKIKLEVVDGAPTITTSHLDVVAEVPNIKEDVFQELATKAKENCPVSRALGSIHITMEAKLR
ncbi:OsmC family protein [Sunxiuqinia elliptica]|uniref:Osmotically inducible protein OsmC n=1 Tax=Sunxiuqinia elliptica TaxID=655355 RepID=A0A4R6HD23_9BACT|nr:OsmC family protein [Sunxiuqinia elliptica]TDO05625.1 osmotically inducible protein OsmC [Sunxiuqinia elliptica]TDO65169.1 osmotically inducible protein OsmC [Sunxiuqinia elliptica]